MDCVDLRMVVYACDEYLARLLSLPNCTCLMVVEIFSEFNKQQPCIVYQYSLLYRYC